MINVKGVKYSIGRMSCYLFLTVVFNIILVETVDSLNCKKETIVDTQGLIWDKKMILNGSSFKHYLFIGDSGEGTWVTKDTYDKYNVGNHVTFNKQVLSEQAVKYQLFVGFLIGLSTLGLIYYVAQELDV